MRHGRILTKLVQDMETERGMCVASGRNCGVAIVMDLYGRGEGGEQQNSSVLNETLGNRVYWFCTHGCFFTCEFSFKP